jgi:PelA/Pel-15E family pectate lyase
MLLRNSFFNLLSFFALVGLSVLAAQASIPPRSWPPDQFLPLVEARIAALPETEQVAWRKYFEVSQQIAKAVPAATVPDFSPDKPLAAPLAGARHSKGLKTDADPKMYATEEARAQASRVGEWQSAAGGWTKGNDYAVSPGPKKGKPDVWSAGTFDNNATIMELRYLALVITAASDDARAAGWRTSFQRGLQYVFNAQYPNGGFPQIYPLVGGYHDAITYNDNAMGRVLEFLGDIATGQREFAFVAAEQRAEAARRLALGISCVLKTQIVEPSGRRTVWCQQHDMLTLKPCAARNFEPIAASAAESTALMQLLMKRTVATAEVVAAVDDAAAWLEKVALRDVVWDRSSYPSKLVPKPGAELLWARMYELETDRPVFGDRDRLIHYEVGEISPERQKGYSWYSEYATSTLKAVKKWRSKLPTAASPKP